MAVVNGFLSFEEIDLDHDGLITHEEFMFKLQPFTVSKEYDTANIVNEANYNNIDIWYNREIGECPATFLWFCIAESLDSKVDKSTYDGFVESIGKYIEFLEGWTINVKDLNLPNLKRALSNYSRHHVRLQGHKIA